MQMDYAQALDFIHGIERFGSRLGLDRVRELLRRLGNPQKKLRFIHVAGTNGKGSTCAMIASVCREAGLKTGLYISPFVIEFRERIQINGEMIPHQNLADLTERVKTVWDGMESEGNAPTEFEVVLAIALLHYAAEGCDIVVLEVGLGGRLDATNVIDAPLVAVITSIGYDHTEYLGHTLAEIAGEKAGIIKSGADVVTSPGQAPEVLAVIMERCAQSGSRLIMGSPNPEILQMTLEGTQFRYGEGEYYLPLLGRHQVDNAITAIEALRIAAERGLPITKEAMKEGIRNVFFPSRMELLPGEPQILVDGAHNLPGMEALCRGLSLAEGREIHAVVGMLADKDVAGAVGKLASLCKAVYAVTPPNSRAMPAEELARLAQAGGVKAAAYPSPEGGLSAALSACPPDGLVLICGSLYLTSHLRPRVLLSAEIRQKAPADDK